MNQENNQDDSQDNNQENLLDDGIDLTKIVFVAKRQNNAILLKEGDDMKKIIIKIDNSKAPFGIEYYKGKCILNAEFTDYENSNEMYNSFAKFQQIDTFFRNLKYDNFRKRLLYKMPLYLINLIKNKTYVSCLKNINSYYYTPLIRTHIKKTTKKTITTFYKNDKRKETLDIDNIKGKIFSFTLELGFLWIKGNYYGLTWYLNGGICKTSL